MGGSALVKMAPVKLQCHVLAKNHNSFETVVASLALFWLRFYWCLFFLGLKIMNFVETMNSTQLSQCNQGRKQWHYTVVSDYPLHSNC